MLHTAAHQVGCREPANTLMHLTRPDIQPDWLVVLESVAVAVAIQPRSGVAIVCQMIDLARSICSPR